MKRPRRLLGLLALCAGALLAQSREKPKPIPTDHPEFQAPSRLEQASRLTEQIAGGAGAVSGPVARKNLIDQHIFGKMERDRIPHAPLASDEEFFRRVHLDLIGRIPEDDALEKFLASKDANKRDKLVDELAASNAYLNKWSHWYLDMSRSVGGIVGESGRNLYYEYIYDALQYNRPYNEMVADLLTTRAFSNWYVAPATYLIRSRILAPVNTEVVHEDTADEMMISSFKHFLGINLQCVSCHDGARHLEKLNLWLTSKTRQQFWQQAFFGKTRVWRRVNVNPGRDEYAIDDTGGGYDARADSVVRLKRTGKGFVEPAFILTGEKPRPDRPLREELARMITTHPQFARATVNTFWAEMMGVGLVDPIYDFDLLRLDPNNPPSNPLGIQTTHPELLDALAEGFRKSGHDLRHLFKTIAKSSAYQLSSRFPGEWKAAYAPYFARKFVRRLTAEQIHDSIAVATGRFTPLPIKESHRRARFMTEVRGPEDIMAARNLKDLFFFVESFGQANRRSTERTTDSSITQAVLLLNSPFILEKVKAEPDSYLGKLLATEKWSDTHLVDKLFVRFLMRRPSAEEKAVALELLARKGQRSGGEDLQWGLLNKVEFLFNN